LAWSWTAKGGDMRVRLVDLALAAICCQRD
jgi:hypothetical protein